MQCRIVCPQRHHQTFQSDERRKTKPVIHTQIVYQGALTAGDRPYKRGLPPEQALTILETEAGHGKIDARLLRVFVESRAWRLSHEGS